MDEDIRKHIGKSLQMARKKAGFKSARAYAEHRDINPYTYTNYEQGNRPLTDDLLWQFADDFNCSIDELVGRRWPPEGASAPEPGEASLVSAYRDLSEEGREVAVNVVAGMRSTYPQEPGSDGLAAEEAV